MATWNVGPGQTYAHPQDAANALFALVGAAEFTETQTIRIYEDDYAGRMDFGIEIVCAFHSIQPTRKYRLVIETVGDVNFSGLYGLAFSQIALAQALSHVTVRGIRFAAGTGDAITLNGDFGIHQPTAEDFILEDLTFAEGVGWHVDVSGSKDLVMRNFHNEGYSSDLSSSIVRLDTSRYVHGFVMFQNFMDYAEAGPELVGAAGETLTVILDHCTIWGENRGLKLRDNGVGPFNYQVNLIMRNNIIVSQGGFMLSLPQNYPLVNVVDCDYNCYGGAPVTFASFKDAVDDCVTFADWQALTGQDAHSIFADPLFVDVTGSMMPAPDFHLQDTSPCLRAGADVPAADIEDNVRASGIDIGVYQQTPLPSPKSTVYQTPQSEENQ